MLASKGGHRDCTELLIIYKADINDEDKVTRDEGREVMPMVELTLALWVFKVTLLVLWKRVALMCRLRLLTDCTTHT